VGPRDGFQYESTPIPTEMKIESILSLARAGLPRIQATSFVHPGRVPQMADAERVVDGLQATAGTVYTGLVLNERGLERAAACGLNSVDLSIATNPRHARDNANTTVEAGLVAAERMVNRCSALGIEAQLGFQTVFGYREPGDTAIEELCRMLERFKGAPLESISLADSTGMANPDSIAAVLRQVRAQVGDTPIVLHLHDTRGLGLANVAAALREGVDRFDTSLGGLGGCPFIPGATGNIATEDTAYLLQALGLKTGIDISAVAAVTRAIARHLGRTLPGKLYDLAPYASS
jgi:hydroxymethylglutaryl-CoA lyase